MVSESVAGWGDCVGSGAGGAELKRKDVQITTAMKEDRHVEIEGPTVPAF